MTESQFIDAPYNTHSCLHKMKVSKDGKYEIGIYVVMYGFRIRAGYAGKLWVELDYCAGSDLVMVNLLYHAILTLLTDRISKGENPFKDLPIQDVKPMINDPECLAKLLEVIKDCHIADVTQITAAELQGYRTKSLEENLNI